MKRTVQKSPLESVLAINLVLLVVYYFYPLEGLIVINILFTLLAVLVKNIANWVDYFWITMTKIIGAFMSTILLSFVFFVFLTPIAILYRFFNKDKLQKKKPRATNFIERNKTFQPKDVKTPW